MHKERHSYLLPVLVLAVALLPSTASANSGTPLMWTSMLHLSFGNAIIGLFEGLCLSRFFKCDRVKAVLTLIVANYASACAGLYLVMNCLPPLADITIETIHFWFRVFILTAFVVTLLIEFPFFWFALRGQARVMRRALVATLVINGVSYALLLGWYGLVSRTSMMSRLELVSADQLKVPEPCSLYYITREGDRVLRMDLSTTASAQPIAEVQTRDISDRLLVMPRDGSGFDLMVLHGSHDEPKAKSRVLEDFAEQAALEAPIVGDYAEALADTWLNFGDVPVLSPPSDWKLETGFWPMAGLYAKNEKTGQSTSFAIELPFAAWTVRNATLIPGDHVVIQLGRDQICMIHLPSRRIALLTRGKGPIVAKPKPAHP